MSAETIITKYRPKDFDTCLGNELVVNALKEAVEGPTCPHLYLMTGITGVGKTTLARVIASKVNASVTEIDAASNSGVESMRELVAISEFRPITIEKNRMYIIDECHSLSKQAWQPLLKLTEHPPEYLYFCLCTTESEKVPSTIKSRAYPVSLKPIKPRDIEDLLLLVAECEGWTVDGNIIQAIVAAAEGSARKALTILQAGHALKTREELSQVVEGIESDENPIIKLCQYLVKGGKDWRTIVGYLKQVEDPDEAINTASRYLVSIFQRSEERQAADVFEIMRAFARTATWDKKIHLNAAIGEFLWHREPF